MSSQISKKHFSRQLKLLITLPISLCVSGCQEVLGASDKAWLWLAIPLLGFMIVGSILIFLSRQHQLKSWDLAQSPSEPSARGIFLWTLGSAVIAAVAFILSNIFSDIGDQWVLNIGFWILGSILGVAIALLMGLKTAESNSF